MILVRKNMLIAQAVFTADNGLGSQPSAAVLSINYKDRAGVPRNTTINMDLNVETQVWTATWDTSAAGSGPVEWMIYGYGMLQAASQGSFELDANSANLAVA